MHISQAVPSTTPPSIGTTVNARPSEAAIDSAVARLAFRMIARVEAVMACG